MIAPATITVNRRTLEAIIEELIALIDDGDANATVEVEFDSEPA